MRRTLTIGLLALAPVALVLGTAFGSVALGFEEWLGALMGGGSDLAREIVWSLRMPRGIAAFVTGGSLALAGVLMQALLRNPLADPYILGLSGGAAVGALAGMVLGIGAAATHALALGGASCVALALVAFAARTTGWEIHRVLLAGVGFAAACGAIVSTMLTLAPTGQVQGMLFWLMGDLGGAGPVLLPAILVGVASLVVAGIAPSIDALALGADKARILGVSVGFVQSVAFVLAATLTVAAVMLAGTVGFVGLIVPHLLRLAGINAHRLLAPLAVLAGGTLLTSADLLARTVAAPIELPVGAATALIGVPVLLWLIARSR